MKMSFNYTGKSPNSTQGNNRYLFWESYLVCKYALRAWSASPNKDASDTGHNHFAEIRASLPEEWDCITKWYPHSPTWRVTMYYKVVPTQSCLKSDTVLQNGTHTALPEEWHSITKVIPTQTYLKSDTVLQSGNHTALPEEWHCITKW
jgi:hypothetical protein